MEGVRRDVRVVNLSLLNTNWYIKQLRDREPKVIINFTDDFIDSVLTDTQQVDLVRRYWPEPQEIRAAGLTWEVPPPKGYNVLRVQDVMAIKIIDWNAWERPIYYAITVGSNSRLNLDPYLRMEGMVLRLVPEKELGADAEKLEHHLFQVYRFRGITDPEVHKDANTSRLLGNYRACVLQLAWAYQNQGRGEDMARLMRWAAEHLYYTWDGYYGAVAYLRDAGQEELAAEYLEEAGTLLLAEYGRDEAANYSNLLALAGLLLNDFAAPDRAERLYRGIIEREPQPWDAYHGLAATLQIRGDLPAALEVLHQFRDQYGEIPDLVEDETILLNALKTRTAAPESSVAQP